MHSGSTARPLRMAWWNDEPVLPHRSNRNSEGHTPAVFSVYKQLLFGAILSELLLPPRHLIQTSTKAYVGCITCVLWTLVSVRILSCVWREALLPSMKKDVRE